jgi:DNA-binding SARP family transcriptional activator
MQSSPVTVRVLGAVELVDSTGHVHPVPGRRMQALLARLVSEAGRVVSVDALTEAMWPEQSPEAPDAALRVFQAHRRHLADELGLEPSPRLRRLEAAILGGEAGPLPMSSAAKRVTMAIVRRSTG